MARGCSKRPLSSTQNHTSQPSTANDAVASSNADLMCAIPEVSSEEYEYLSFLENQEALASVCSTEPGISTPNAFQPQAEQEAEQALARQHQHENVHYGSTTECNEGQVSNIPFATLTMNSSAESVGEMRANASGLQQQEWIDELEQMGNSDHPWTQRRFEDMCARVGGALPDVCPSSYIDGDGRVRRPETYKQQDGRRFRQHIMPTLTNMTSGPIANVVGGIGSMQGRSVQDIHKSTDTAALVDRVLLGHRGVRSKANTLVNPPVYKSSDHQAPFRPNGFDHRGRMKTSKRRR